MQVHISDPAKNTNVNSSFYVNSLVNNTGFQKSFTISKTDAPTAVNMQFPANGSYYETCGTSYPPNDLIVNNMIQINSATTTATGTGATTTTICYSFLSTSLDGTYKISGDDSNIKLEMVQQGVKIDILLQKQ